MVLHCVFGFCWIYYKLLFNCLPVIVYYNSPVCRKEVNMKGVNGNAFVFSSSCDNILFLV